MVTKLIDGRRFKTGGRRPGSKNKKTLRRARMLAAVLNDLQEIGKEVDVTAPGLDFLREQVERLPNGTYRAVGLAHDLDEADPAARTGRAQGGAERRP